MPSSRVRAGARSRIGHQAVVDVAYHAEEAFAACLLVRDLSAPQPEHVLTASHRPAADYEPGELYRRELPPILRVLGEVQVPLDTIVIDGYVWLDGNGRPGLGAWLFAALQERVPVVGVAKSRFGRGAHAQVVLRGCSRRPLFVTAAGIAPPTAAAWIRGMHGEHRLPTLLRLADQISRRLVQERRGGIHLGLRGGARHLIDPKQLSEETPKCRFPS